MDTEQLKVLILSDYSKNSAGTTIDHIHSFRKYSKNKIYYFNPCGQNIPDYLKLDVFDVVVIHYSIYCILETYLNYSWRKAISGTRALKVQFIQDEYRHVNKIHDFLNDCLINILFTCFPKNEIKKAYPPEKLPDLLIINTLTGYVPEYFEKKYPDFKNKRPTDVGYRARGVGLFWLGELYQEKVEISKKFIEYAKGESLILDISNLEQDRIYGKKWLNFLKKSRCVLATESGASVIDFTGDIEKTVKEYCKMNPNADFKEIQNIFLIPYENKIMMNQISPRIFESIGMGCCLILYEGKYSNILKADRHYITLKKDFSNIKEVFERIKDEDLIKNIAITAYNEIIYSGLYSYKKFIYDFDEVIDKNIFRKDLNTNHNAAVSFRYFENFNDNDNNEILPKTKSSFLRKLKSKNKIKRIKYLIKHAAKQELLQIFISTYYYFNKSPFFTIEKIRVRADLFFGRL